MHERESALKEWLVDILKHKNFALTALAGDASFRRYFRLRTDHSTHVVMDAPPEKEDIQPFVYIAKKLSDIHVHTPEIIAVNQKKGFLLLSDLGDALLLNSLHPDTVNDHYHHAINTLLKIQECSINDPQIPYFDKAFMLKEMSLCPEWFFKKYLHLELSDTEQHLIQETIEWVATEVSQQPQTFIHRDYHSRNLMLVKKEDKYDLGVIDFQDAMQGPLTYDLVSLLKDCYISWPREDVLKWVTIFHSKHEMAQNYLLPDFIRAFDLCGLQRHLKVLGIFSRLFLRDNKAGYLANLPLTLKYVLECTEIYEELHPFFHFLQKRVYLV